MDSYDICYNLAPQSIPTMPPLPEAYIVQLNQNRLEYIQKQATTATLSGYHITVDQTVHEQLLDICSELKIIALEQRFQPKKARKKQTLAQLAEDPKSKELLFQFIEKKLSTFYQLVNKHQPYIGFDLKRVDPVFLSLISITSTPLYPILNFIKTEEGIDYSFSLQDQDHIFLPKDQNIQILLNKPSWILVNKKLFQIQDLNAHKLKPFLQKEKITIAQKNIQTYLEKIIVPVIKKTEVNAEGFEIYHKQTITSVTLAVVHHFINDTYVAKLSFDYDGDIFEYHHKKSTASQINYDGTHISIQQTRRNPEEEETFVQQLMTLGLQRNENLFLEVPMDNEDPFAIIDWIKKHYTTLTKQGFLIQLPTFQDQSVSLASYSLDLTSKLHKDWFDIKGTVHIGDQIIPFSKFIPYIRKRDRYFPLDQNEVFIIPQEWMTKYKPLANFGNEENDSIVLSKSKYTLLKDIVPPEQAKIDQLEDAPIVYETSSNLQATLRPYQLEGTKWLVKHYHNGLGACLADDMGLGKTLQTIAALVYAKELVHPESEEKAKIQFDLFSSPLEVSTFLKALIVLPSSLVFNWAHEIMKFAPHLKTVNYTGPNRKNLTPYLASYDIILTTYGTIARDYKNLQKHQFTYLIIDESQQIKNKDSKIFGAINEIKTLHKISLSGTPIENSLSDLWSQMQFINPGILGSFSFFKNHFKIPIEKDKNLEKIAELKSLIDPFILRRTKEQVAKDLPELTTQIHYSQMDSEQEKLYESQKSAARNALLGIHNPTTNKIAILNTLMRLRQLANHPVLQDETSTYSSGKFEDVTQYLNTLIKAQKKVLIFSSFVSHLELYEQWSKDHNISYLTLTGQTAAKDREKIVTRFQEEEGVSLFFISLKAGGVGLNLTQASYVVLLDPWWNPFIEKQAIARAHRIGQTKNVMVTRFITKNTLEEKIIELQEQKKTLSDEVIDIHEIPDYITEDLETILL